MGTLGVWSRYIQGWCGVRNRVISADEKVLFSGVSGTSCSQAVSVEVVHIVFEMVGVRRDCSVALCANPEEAHCIEC